MKKIFKNIIAPQLLAVILLMSISNLTYSQNKPQFIKNKGQFHTNINFKLEHQAGNIYFEKEQTILEKNKSILDSIKLISKKELDSKKIKALQKKIDSIKMN